jgi:hypothetical protein
MNKKYTFTMVVVKPTGKDGKPLNPKPIKPKNKSTGGSIEKVPGGYSKEGSGRISDKGLKGRSPSQAFFEKEKRMENTKPQGMTKKMGGGIMKKYNKGGEMLKGGQRKLDKNKDGKISSEDFKLIRREKPEIKPLKAREGKMVKTPDGKKEEDKYSKYVRSIELPDAKDIRKVVKKKAMGGEMKQGKVQKAFLGKMIKGAGKSIGRLFGRKKTATATPSGEGTLGRVGIFPGEEFNDGPTKPLIDYGNIKPASKGRMMKASKGGGMMQRPMGGEIKKGYGAARQSGMGLQDENLQPGKSMDYYKDLI